MPFLALALAAAPQHAAAAPVSRPAGVMNASEIELSLRKLQVLGSALYFAAHPDDENTAMIAWLSKGRLMRTGYLALTRGDGGQNLIGDEKGPALGIIRTQELIAAREIDGGNQFFSRAIDFGYSKSPEETLRIWGHDEILADAVWVIRRFRPDVIITRFPTTGEGGHGHHTASAMLAVEAFKAAGDPTRFPEQLKYVEPWSPKRVLWNDWRAQQPDNKVDVSTMIKVDLGAYSPLLGRSFTEIAGAARSMHKSQGFGAAERRGTLVNYLSMLGGAQATSDAFEGIDTSWARVQGGGKVSSILAEAERSYDPTTPSKIVPILLRALDALDTLDSKDPWIAVKRAELIEVIRSATGLWVEAIASSGSATPGTTAGVKATVINRSGIPMQLESIAPPFGAEAKQLAKTLDANQPLTIDIDVAIPADAAISQPYWLAGPPTGGRYSVDDLRRIGTPENPPAASFRFRVTVDGHAIELESPALYRWVDPVRGELYRPFVIAPKVTANLDEPVYVFPDTKPRTIRATIRAGANDLSGKVRMTAPAGWRITPESQDVKLAKAGDETTVAFAVTPPAKPSVATLGIAIEMSPAVDALSRRTVEYDHIPPQVFYEPATVKAVREDLARRGSRVGYVKGSGDQVPDALRQAGYSVTLLSDDDLAAGNLSAFDAIVLGVRSANTRDALVRHLDRVFAYVEAGGTCVMQYNTTDKSLPAQLGPWPFEISRDRVTVEEAPMTFVKADSPLLNVPNKITAGDFAGWVQERGLYFAGKRDAHYESVFTCNDPGEKPSDGSLIYGKYGKGVFIYTGLAFFRQLPAGVPGAYKLFVNLVSARQ